MKIQESGENYLETILILKNRNGYVRSVDIANELSFTKASVSRAMSILRKAGLIVMEKSGNIVLTESGFARASAVYERHTVLSDFFRKVLGLSLIHICRRINSTGRCYEDDVAELKARQAEIWELLKARQRDEL